MHLWCVMVAWDDAPVDAFKTLLAMRFMSQAFSLDDH